MLRLGSLVGVALALGALVLVGCGSSSNATATHPASAAVASSTVSTAKIGGVTATSRSIHHIGDAETVRIDGNAVQAKLLKVFDPANNPVFWPGIPSDLDAGSRYVGVELSFTNQAQQPEAIGQARILQPLDKQFNVTGQLSSGGADESANHYITGFDSCTAPDAATTLAPGAIATYCAAFKVASGAQLIEVDWNGVDTTNDEATWAVP